jgi:tRNA threonylcarbamoyladenosine biosynthesis protein TsaB
MKILLIDTCGSTGSIAFADTALDPPILAATTLPGRSASERLVATIRDLAATHNLPLHSLDAVAVVSGPGSFTGVRVGLSAAKGLCEALSLPLIAVSRLAVLAGIAATPASAPLFALLGAGRGEVYLRTSHEQSPSTESLVTRDQLIAAIDQAKSSTATKTQPIVVTCEAALAESLAELSPLLVRDPTAEDALPLVIHRLLTRDFDDIATIDANYLRRTDAEIFVKRAAAPNVRPAESPVP